MDDKIDEDPANYIDDNETATAIELYTRSTRRALYAYTLLFLAVFVVCFGLFIYLLISGIGAENATSAINTAEIGLGTIFTTLIIFSLMQLKQCFTCKSSSDLATFCLRRRDLKRAFKIMDASSCFSNKDSMAALANILGAKQG